MIFFSLPLLNEFGKVRGERKAIGIRESLFLGLWLNKSLSQVLYFSFSIARSPNSFVKSSPYFPPNIDFQSSEL